MSFLEVIAEELGKRSREPLLSRLRRRELSGLLRRESTIFAMKFFWWKMAEGCLVVVMLFLFRCPELTSTPGSLSPLSAGVGKPRPSRTDRGGSRKGTKSPKTGIDGESWRWLGKASRPNQCRPLSRFPPATGRLSGSGALCSVFAGYCL